jgi:alginate O-acetyltransferase complex protein AlgI
LERRNQSVSMLFNSYAFLLVFLPAALLVYAFIDRLPRARIPTLIALSFTFYGYWDIRFVPLLAASILINWLAARAFIATKRGSIVTLAIVLDLAVLVAFKYWNFFADNLQLLAAASVRPHLAVALPLGISFFTFHHVMYLADLRRGRAPAYPLDRYALYICFFPQVLSGPLVRWNEVMDQFGRRAFRPGWQQRWALGLTFIVVGLAEKVALGDPLAAAIDPIYAQAQAGAVADGRAVIAVVGFPFQVFFDFAGYSDIAIGLGLLFGIELPLNFNGPYRAASLPEFWRRWHMTLARFLRDYLFYPMLHSRLGGAKARWLRALASILFTMAVCGLWHGAGWHFVLWGLTQGLGLVVAVAWRRYLRSPPVPVGWALTVGYFILTTGLLFRASSLEATWNLWNGLVVPVDWSHQEGLRTLAIAIACAILLPPSHRICRLIASQPRPVVAVAMASAGVALLVMLGSDATYEFVYFQF